MILVGLAVLLRMSCSGSMKARCYVGFCIVWREDHCECTPDAIRCTGQDGRLVILLIGCIREMEVKWHVVDVLVRVFLVCLRLHASVVKLVVTEIRSKRTITNNKLASNLKTKGAVAWKTLFP